MIGVHMLRPHFRFRLLCLQGTELFGFLELLFGCCCHSRFIRNNVDASSPRAGRSISMTVEPGEFAFDARRRRRLFGSSANTKKPNHSARRATDEVRFGVVFHVVFVLHGGPDAGSAAILSWKLHGRLDGHLLLHVDVNRGFHRRQSTQVCTRLRGNERERNCAKTNDLSLRKACPRRDSPSTVSSKSSVLRGSRGSQSHFCTLS
jgi:hypothetical protein